MDREIVTAVVFGVVVAGVVCCVGKKLDQFQRRRKFKKTMDKHWSEMEEKFGKELTAMVREATETVVESLKKTV